MTIVNLKKFEINKKVFNSPCVGVVHFERDIFEEIALNFPISEKTIGERSNQIQEIVRKKAISSNISLSKCTTPTHGELKTFLLISNFLRFTIG